MISRQVFRQRKCCLSQPAVTAEREKEDRTWIREKGAGGTPSENIMLANRQLGSGNGLNLLSSTNIPPRKAEKKGGAKVK